MSLDEKEIRVAMLEESAKEMDTLRKDLDARIQEEKNMYALIVNKGDKSLEEKGESWDSESSEESIYEDLKSSLEINSVDLDKLKSINNEALIIRMAICHKTPISELKLRSSQIKKLKSKVSTESKENIATENLEDQSELDKELMAIQVYFMSLEGIKRSRVESTSFFGSSIGLPYKVAFFIMVGIIYYFAYIKKP